MKKIVFSLLTFPVLGMAGPLEPSGPPGPSMYTLQSIYDQLSIAMPEQTLSASSTVVSAGYYDYTTLHTIDPDLAASNILVGVEIFGFAGGWSSPAGMSLIPAGSFTMGASTNVGHESITDAKPQHTVYVSAFYMDQYEVTKALWGEVRSWAITNGYSFGSAGFGKATNHPVHSVDWYDAIAWCNARSEREGLTPCYTNANGTVYKLASGNSFDGGCNWSANGYRLPTEAEWEKAARGGAGANRFPWDDTITHNDANYSSSASSAYDTSNTRSYHPTFNDASTPYTSPVGYFAPNGYGLYDMAGNVYELCWDWYGSSYYSSSPSTDPKGPSSGLCCKVMRGGSWISNALHVAGRAASFPDDDLYYLGFRCARGL
jgi:formylglycine-generating enzyme required for sulfatase activity